MLVGGLESLDRRGWVNLNRRESVVMQAQDLAAAHKLRGLDGILNAHSEVVSDGQRREIQRRGFTDQLHVRRQRRIARVIEIPLSGFDDEPAGVPAIRPVRQAARMDRVHELYPATPFSIFPFDGWSGSGAVIASDAVGNRNLYFQGYDGRMRQADTGTDDCGAAINSYFETSRMKVDKVPALKKTQQVQPLFKAIGNYNVTFGYRTNFNAGYVDADINLSGSGFTLGSSLLGSATLGGQEGKIGVVDIPRLFNFLQIRLKSNSTDPRMNMYTIDLMATSEGIAKV